MLHNYMIIFVYTCQCLPQEIFLNMLFWLNFMKIHHFEEHSPFVWG